MNLINLFKIALEALGNNKTRALLTMLGIIIGVASVITMLAIGEGSKRSIQGQISEMGSNLIIVSPQFNRTAGVRQSSGSMQTLKIEDYQAIAENNSFISEISPAVNSSGQAINGSNNWPTSMIGVNQDYLDIRKYKIGSGDIFTERDIQTAAKVCIVGQTVVDNLFTNGEDPIGKYIRFNAVPFQIIGVLESKGTNTMGNDQDDLIIAPYTTVQKRVLAITYINSINISAISEKDTDAAIDVTINIMRERHKIREGEEDDFRVRSQQEMLNMMSATTNTMTVLLACVAGISLLIGGIGIMNIMYVSVTERTREIGLRMSIGARGIDILLQFLIEAIVICIAGGVIGIVLGFAATYIVEFITKWPVYIQTFSVVLSFVVCTITGVFFGWYPARKASNLDPIEALRYE
jgi:putative ABC transport system permease protein